MDHTISHSSPCTGDGNDDQLVARLYELTRNSDADDAELESLDAIVYQRLLQTYGDDVTEPLEA